jgi:transcription termination factor Rho
MYDILQLNDMLVPELMDIAEKLKITGTKKLDKQGLIYKILDKQALLNSKVKDVSKEEKGVKKKRIVKTTTSNSTEEAIVESVSAETEKIVEAPVKKIEKKIEESDLEKKI